MIINIDDCGKIELVASGELAETIMLQGVAVKRRASFVEPVNYFLRWAFHAVRAACADRSRFAAWTRGWRCAWRVAIVGGPVLSGEWVNRKAAIAAEVEWLNANGWSHAESS